MARRTTKPHAVPHVHTGNSCRAMVRVDSRGIRHKIQKEYEKALRELENARRVVEQFQQADQPQFSQWMSRHFGALLTELRELTLKLAADDAIVLMVQREVMFRGGSYARAYKRVMELQEKPEAPPPPPPPRDAWDGQGDGWDAGPDWGDPDDPDAALKALFDAMFGEVGPDFDPRNPRGARFGAQTEPAATAHASKRLKELYRAVVRRLHPDAHREMTAQKTEWWHQAQAAYEAGDANQLEVLLTLCEMGESGTTAHTSASLLQRITAQFKSSLRELKRQINQWRREPAWNFSKRTDLMALAEQVRQDLTGELMVMRRRWMKTQAVIAQWKAAAEKRRPTRRGRSRPTNPEFQF